MRLRTGNNHSDAFRTKKVFPQYILFRNPMIKTGRDSVMLCSLVDSHGDKGIYKTEKGTTLSNVPYNIAKRDAAKPLHFCSCCIPISAKQREIIMNMGGN